MRQLDFRHETYRQRQTRLHRAHLKKSSFSPLQVLYSTLLLSLVLATFLNTLSHGSKVVVKTIKEPEGEAKTILKPSFLNLASLPLPRPVKAFAQAARPTTIPIPTETDSWGNFTEEARSIARLYSFPVNLMLAQAALESGHGTSRFARERNNYFGIGAYDWQPNEAFAYENQAQSIIDYIYVIKNNFPEAWANRNDAETMLHLLESNSYGTQYASDPDYIEKVESEPEWRNN